MKKLTRSPDDKWLGGVCGGLSIYTGIDVNIIRVIVAVGSVLGIGTLVVAYVIAWFLVPMGQPTSPTIWPPPQDPTTTTGP